MKKDDEKGQRKLTLEEALDATRSIFGAKEEKPEMGPFFKRVIERRDEAKNREEIKILDSLEFPGGKRIH